MLYSEIVRFAEVITKNRDLARDITHETYIRLHRQGIDLLNNSKTKSYIFTCLQRASIEYYRKYSDRKRLKETPPINKRLVRIDEYENCEVIDLGVSPENIVIGAEILDLVRNQIITNVSNRNPKNSGIYSSKYLQIFQYWIDGYTPKEIAKIFNCTTVNIRNYQRHIKTWIKPILKA